MRLTRLLSVVTMLGLLLGLTVFVARCSDDPATTISIPVIEP